MDARLIGLAAVLVACSSSTPDRYVSCGSGAGTPISVVVKTNAGNAFIPAPGVEVTWSGCDDRTVTDDRGEGKIWLSAGRTFAPRLQRDGLTTTLWPELTVRHLERLEHIVLRDSMGVAYGLTNDASLLWIKVYPGATCTEVEGVELTVEGHPEAKVEYLHGDGPIDPTLKATTTAGSAVVRGLTGKVVVRASKSGCTANTGPWGAVPLERGVISAAPIYLQ